MTACSVTAAYGATHDAFTAVARDRGVAPTDVRVLVAVFERDGAARCDEVQADALMSGSAVRRASLSLRAVGLIVAGDGNGGAPVRGSHHRMTLTLDGRRAAIEALARVWSSECAEMFG